MVSSLSLKNEQKEFILIAYRLVASHHWNIGFDELLGHHFNSDNFMVQSTSFSSGFEVSVNFDCKDFILPDGAVVPKYGFLIRRDGKVEKKGGFKIILEQNRKK